MTAIASKIVRTMCPMSCHPTLCGMLAEVRDGKLVGVKGDEANPDSQGFLCVRGQASREIIDNPARLLHPLIRDRRTDAFRRAGWDEALDRIVSAMALSDPQSVGIWPGHGIFTTNYGTRIGAQLLARFANFHGSPVLEPFDDLLGSRRLRTRTDRHARDEHEGGHGRAFATHHPLGGQPDEPAEYGAIPACGEAPRRAHRYDRRAQDRGRREVGRRAHHQAGHRYRAGIGVDACDLRRSAPRRGVRREAYGRVRSAGRASAGVSAGLGGGSHRHSGRANRGAGATIRRHAAGDDRARRKLDAQRRQWLAGRTRDCLSAGTDRKRRHSGRWLRSAPRQRRSRARPGKHHRAGAPSTRDDHSEPDVRGHGRVTRRPHPDAAADGHEHAVVVRRRAGKSPPVCSGPGSW